jgi:hypothetical protein
MTDDDFRAIIAVVEQRLRDVGAEELANPELYVRRDEDAGEWRRLPPQWHLLDTLKAFDRWLAVRDGTTGAAALARINAVLSDGRMEDAVVTATGEDAEGSATSLRQAPILETIRRDLRILIGRLIEQPRSGGAETMGA